MSAVLNQERQRAGRTPRSPQRPPTLSPAQSKTLIRVAFRTPGVLIAICTTVVLVTLVSANSDLTGTFGAIAGLWFAVHHVPLSIAGTSLGVLPLLPTLVLAVVVARAVARTVTEAPTRRECGLVFGAAVLGPLFVTALALAVAADASAVIGLDSPHALLAFAWVGGVHAVSAAIGVAVGTWNSEAMVARSPQWSRRIVTPTVRAGSVLVAGSGAIVAASMVASWSTMDALLDSGDGFVGVLGLTVLSILYLPNVMVGALAVSVGSSAHVGEVAVSMFRSVGGPVPPLPVLAVLPEGAAHSLWLLMLIVPLTAGVFLGRDCARRAVDVNHALSSVWLGAAAIGVAALILGFVAGGNLGTFGTIEVTVWSFGLLVFAWVAVVGSVAAAVTAWRAGTRSEDEAEPESASVPVETTAIAAIAQPAELEGGPAEEAAVEAEVVEAAPVEVDAAVEAEVVAPEPDGDDQPIDAEIVDVEKTEDLPDKPPSESD